MGVKTAVVKYRKPMNRAISPPPTKRRKTTASTAAASASKPCDIKPARPPTLRIFSWNINGISPFLQPPIPSFFQATQDKSNLKQAQPPIHAASLRAFLHRHHWPTLLFLQEVKISAQDTKAQDAVRTAVNVVLPSERGADSDGAAKRDRPLYTAHFTLPTDTHNARGPRGSGKVYGVCSIVRDGIADFHDIAVRNVDWDCEGRVSVVQVTCPQTRARLAIFNIYAVNGTQNAYREGHTGAVCGTRHDRKREFQRLLMHECRVLEAQGWDVLLAGDMNVAPDERDGYPKLRVFPHDHVVSRADFHEKLLEGGGDAKESGGLHGVDIWRKMHGEERRYTYFPRNREWGSSCDRVDYFIAGRRFWDKGCVKACGIMDSEAERGPSDHVPIWADVELKADAN
ncbi:hypothetical protein ACJBU6_00220 [Exserohilum turcicum]